MKTVIKENAGYRLVLSKNSCLRPEGLFHLEFTGEQLTDGEITNSSTYQFFMTQEEIEKLSEALAR